MHVDVNRLKNVELTMRDGDLKLVEIGGGVCVPVFAYVVVCLWVCVHACVRVCARAYVSA